ncbi:hypothetical protein KIPB_000918, partial [Kipferlia bialata]
VPVYCGAALFLCGLLYWFASCSNPYNQRKCCRCAPCCCCTPAEEPVSAAGYKHPIISMYSYA